MHIKILLVFFALLSTVSLAGAEMYQWVDANGVVTFKDTPPPASKKRIKVKVYKDSAPAQEPQRPPQQPSLKSGTASFDPTIGPNGYDMDPNGITLLSKPSSGDKEKSSYLINVPISRTSPFRSVIITKTAKVRITCGSLLKAENPIGAFINGEVLLSLEQLKLLREYACEIFKP